MEELGPTGKLVLRLIHEGQCVDAYDLLQKVRLRMSAVGVLGFVMLLEFMEQKKFVFQIVTPNCRYYSLDEAGQAYMQGSSQTMLQPAARIVC